MWYAERMNTPKTGFIYHVVDKTTGEVVKVGSTIQKLTQRFNSLYKKKYPNHFLSIIKTLQSSELDWFEPRDSFCPFMWHLVASEHIEILRCGTFNSSPLSNKQSPLDQKFFGFDAQIAGRIGGKIGGKIGGRISGPINIRKIKRTTEHQIKAGKAAGKKSVEDKTGIHHPNFDKVTAGRKGGIRNVESGHLQRISSAGGKVSGAIQGQKNKESGHMAAIGRSVPYEVRRINSMKGGPIGMHIRWHINRGIVSPDCKLCKEEKNCIH